MGRRLSNGNNKRRVRDDTSNNLGKSQGDSREEISAGRAPRSWYPPALVLGQGMVLQQAAANCGWEATNYKNAQAIGYIHAKRKRHKVHVEVGLGGYYDGR